MKELGGKTGVLVGPDLPSAGWELKQGSDPHIRAIGWVRGETLKAESEAADLWQPKWNENQTVPQNWKQPRCSSTKEWIKKLWYTT